ncbi:MAG: NUDIX domain-containing protein [Bdellovibrionota bacterium]
MVKRRACRAVLLTPQNEVLLIKIANPNGKWVGWITPGGGIDEGESIEAALERELLEEVGFGLFLVVGHIWKRSMIFEWNGKEIDQTEDFFLIETERFDVPEKTDLTPEEAGYIKEIRWWRVEDIEKSNETFAPAQLVSLLKDVIINGTPPEPVDAGV